MYSVEVFASGNARLESRTFFMSTYSWPAISAALAGVREDFAWRYGDEQGNPTRIREPQVGETLTYQVGTEAQFENTFTGRLILKNSSEFHHAPGTPVYTYDEGYKILGVVNSYDQSSDTVTWTVTDGTGVIRTGSVLRTGLNKMYQY